MGGRALPHLAGPWVVTVSLALAGLTTAVGTHLSVYMPFHDITETFGTALRGWVPQALCLPAMARLVLALGQRGAETEPPPADTPSEEGTVSGPTDTPPFGGPAAPDEDGEPGGDPGDGRGTPGGEGSGPNGTRIAHDVEEAHR